MNITEANDVSLLLYALDGDDVSHDNVVAAAARLDLRVHRALQVGVGPNPHRVKISLEALAEEWDLL